MPRQDPNVPSQIQPQQGRNPYRRGKLSDSLMLSIPDRAYAQQQALPAEVRPYEKPLISKAIEDFIGMAPKMYKAQVEEGKKISEQGYLEGLKAENEENKRGWKELRDKGEVTLHDDPWFQEGYRKGKGELAQIQYREGLLNWYEREKNNPKLYQDPEAFETALKLRFDLAFSQLPQDSIVQSNFMKNIVPVQEKIKAQYKTDLNTYEKNEYLVDQEGRHGAEFVTYRDALDMVSGMTDEEAMTFLAGYEFELEGDEEIEFTPLFARNTLKEFAYNDLIENLDQLGEELFQFQGEREGGLGVNPTEARLKYIMDAADDNPLLAMRIIRDLKSGTGMLSETSRGKAALGELATKTKAYARAEESRERTERNRIEAESLEELVFPQEDLEADINTFEDVMRETGKSADQLREDLMRRSEALFGDDFDVQRARVEGAIKEAHRRATRPDKETTTQAEINRAAIADRMTLMDVALGRRPMSNEGIAIQARGERDFVELNRSEYRRQTTDRSQAINEQYLNNPQSERAATAFWNQAQMIDELNNQYDLGVRMDTMYSSPALNMNPVSLGVLREARRRNILGAFVDPNGEIGSIIQDLGAAPGLSDEAYANAIREEMVSRKREEVSEAQSRILGGDPNSIPFRGADDEPFQQLGVQEVLEELGVDAVISDESKREFARRYYDKLEEFVNDGYSERAAAQKVVEFFEERDNFGVIELSDKGGREISIFRLPGDSMQQKLVGVDEDRLADATHQLLSDFDLQSNSDFDTAAAVQLESFEQETKSRVIKDRTSQEAWDQFVSDAESTPIDKNRLINYLRVRVGRPTSMSANEKRAYTEGAIAYIQAIQGDMFPDQDTYAAINQAGLERLNTDIPQRDPKSRTFYSDEIFRDSSIFGIRTEKRKLEWIQDTTNQIESEFRANGPQDFIEQYLGPEATQVYTNYDSFLELAESLRPNTDIFDMDGDIMIEPAGARGQYKIVDQRGRALTRRSDRGTIIITAEDIMDRVSSYDPMSDQDLYAVIKEKLGLDPTLVTTSVNRTELESILEDYFEGIPENLPLRAFREKFGPAAKRVYTYYKDYNRR